MKHAVRIALIACTFVVAVQSTLGYVQFTSGTANARWNSFPIQYALNARGPRDVPLDQAFTAVRASIASWGSIPYSSLAFSEHAGPVTTEVSPLDGINVVVWIDDASDPTFLAKDLVGATTVTFDPNTGQITDADIALNAVRFSWTTSADGSYTSASGPYDVQDVVTHELGHFVGLDHVTTRTSIMFPTTYAGSVSARTLSQDEISAEQSVYPGGGAPLASSISGFVARSGVGVRRAYVACYQSGKPIVGAIADANGNYFINRVPPGNYFVRVQPYSTSQNITQTAFFQQAANVDVDFLSVIYPNATQEGSATTVVVPGATNVAGINFTVSASQQYDPFEVDNTSGTAKQITVDGLAHLKHSWPGTPLPGPGDLDWVSFTATLGRVYVIETRNLGVQALDGSPSNVNSRTALALYDQTGSGLLAQNVFRNRLENDPGSRIVWRETNSTGTRFVQISQRDTQPFAAGAGVFYDISVHELSPPFAAPSVTSVTPPQSTTNGGTVVTVRGNNFLPGATVTFGGTAGTEEDVQECSSDANCHAIRVVVPAHAAGTVAVQVTNPDLQFGTIGSGFTYNAQRVGVFIDGTVAAFGDNFGRGSVVCWGDYDGDGDEDLYAPYSAENTINEGELWRNNGDGTFTDVTAASGLNTSNGPIRASCSWVDYDNDGRLDLFVVYAGTGASNRLYRNNGGSPPTFTDVAAAAGVVGNVSIGKSDAAWADYDNDGDLDLYLVYGESTPNQLFRNNGNQTFTDVSAGSTLDIGGQGGRALWADYDNDGLPDLYVLRRSGAQDVLFHNDGKGIFSRVNAPAGIVEGPNCFDGAWADFNNDGYLDLLCIGDSLPGSQPQRLWINQHNGTFKDHAVAAGINGLGRHGTSVTVLDKDNDGDIDVYLGCGSFSGFPSASLDALLENNGANPPVFTNVSGGATGVDETANPREAFSVGAADYNNDFFTDVLVVGSGSVGNDDNYLWRNTSNTNSAISVRLFGTVTNTEGVGAEVVVIPALPGADEPTENLCLLGADSPPAMRQEVILGSKNQSPTELSFGLGTRPIERQWVDCLIVYWPRSGLRQVFTKVAVNSRVDVLEDPGEFAVTRVTPSSGTTAGGTQVTIIGFGFDPQMAAVVVDSNYAFVVSRQDSNVIVVSTPPHSAGLADVQVVNPGNPTSHSARLPGAYTYISPSTKIRLLANKDFANNAVDLTWAGIGQLRYRVRRAIGPTPADFSANFRSVVPRTDFQDTGKLNDIFNYYYLVDEGEP